MKIITKKILFLFTILAIMFSSCESDDGDDSPTDSNCEAPTDLTIEILEEDFFGDTVALNWTAGENESQWEITKSASLLSPEKSFIVDEPQITIVQVLGSDKAVFTIQSICGDNLSSELVTFPSLDGFAGTQYANMTAEINGQEYNSLKPPTISLGGDASSIITWSGHDGVHLRLLGTNRSSFSFNGLEINLYINQNEWTIGEYELKGRDNIETDEENSSFVEYFNLDEPDYYFDVIETGVLNVTNFDREQRIIEGTFSFTYEKSNLGNDTVVVTENVENGTFKYSLDDEFFD